MIIIINSLVQYFRERVNEAHLHLHLHLHLHVPTPTLFSSSLSLSSLLLSLLFHPRPSQGKQSF